MTALPNNLVSKEIVKKWAPILDAKDAPTLKGRWARETMAAMLENEQRFLKSEQTRLLSEATPTSVSGNVAKWNPVLISMVRRIMPQLMHNDLVGNQPMSGPVGMVFAKKTRYDNASGAEAFINPADTTFTGKGTGSGGAKASTDVLEDIFGAGYSTGTGVDTASGEGDINNQITFTVESTTVTTKTRRLKTTHSHEMAQDLEALHGMDADAELSADAQEEMVQEMNRELARTIYITASAGAADTATPGTFDAAAAGDSDGRWMAERFRGLQFRLDLEANAIWQATRRGKGNKIIVSANVASALNQAGLLEYGSILDPALEVDVANTTYAGKLNNQYDVHIDPFVSSIDFAVVGYKGAGPFDAGLFYCPYIPLWRVNGIDPASGQPISFYKTRYGIVSNPFVTKSDGSMDGESLTAGRNTFFRKFKITNLT